MTAARAADISPDASMRVVVLHGKEPFLRAERTRALEAALEAEHGAIDRFVYDGATADLSDVLDELRSYALIGPHKLVVVDNAEQFLAKEGRRPALEAYAEAPMADATLLMRAETWRAGRFDKAVAKVGAVVKCDALGDAAAARWCTARARDPHGCRLDAAAAARLVGRVGADLGLLDAEIGKLAAAVGERSVIDAAVIDDMVAPSRQEQAWIIQSAILSGSPRDAVATLRDLLTVSRQPETLVMWAITDLLRKLHAGARMAAAGRPAGAIAKQLRLWGPSRDPMLAAIRRSDPDRLAELLRRAIRTDVANKTGLGRPDRSLEGLTLLLADTIA